MPRGFPALFTVLLGVAAVLPSFVTAQRDSRAPLELVDKGYENLLIGISERVPVDLALLDRIKFVFEETSRFLYQATKGMAYFKDVHILIPESWPDSDEYANIGWQRYDQSDVRIDIPSEGATGNRPYVNKKTPCGEPGDFIHLTPDYIRSQNLASRYGPYDKTLVHEWAHYRWGVFDEYPLGNDPHFYADPEGNIQAVRCVLKIKGRRINPRKNTGCEVDENGIPESECRFLDDTAASDYTGSLMYKQFLPAISTFCEKFGNDADDKNEHNRDAPNLQNRLCSGKSIWEVMLQHRDFAPMKLGENDINGGGSSDRGGGGVFNGEPVPTFNIVKKRSSRLVLVLDRSGSMEGQRLIRLRQAAECLISTILRDGEQLGIVEFDKLARVRSNLLTINDANRQILLQHIPTVANGATSIGAGIKSGLDVLSDGDMSPEGGKLLVITDGEENRDPKISDVLPLVNVSGVTVDTIALGLEASPHLELLSSLTGGISFAYNGQANSLCDALGKSSTTDKDITSTPVNVYSELVKIPMGQNFTGVVYLDSTIGRDTEFLFDPNDVLNAAVRLTDPDGKVLTEGSPEYGIIPSYERIRISIPGNAKVGLWTFEVSNRLPSLQNVSIQVLSHAREGKEPITVKSKWGYAAVVPPQKQSLYVTVGQGYIPVLDSEVKAVVELPCGVGNQTVELYPKDDGAGADIIKGDGVYSAYFTEFCKEGRYGVNVMVGNKGGTTSVAFGRVVGTGSAPNPEYTGDDVEFQADPTLQSTGNFSRVTIGGSFKCEGSYLCNGSVDMYPPSRITDLRAGSLDTTTLQVTLTFTAPGDDLTTGRASRYIIVMSRNIDDIYDNFEAVPEIPPSSYVQGDVMMTKETGNTEVFVVKVPEIGHFSYSFAVVAVDDEENRSEPSNVASASARDFKALGIGAIIGLAIGGALLLAVVTVLVIFLIRRRKNGKGDDPLPKNEALGQSVAVDPERNVYGNTNNVPGKQAGSTAITGQHQAVSRSSCGPETNRGFIGGGQIEVGNPVYDECISRRDRDPNWDPTLPNNREGGGAHIKPGHVADARAKFNQMNL